LLSYTGQLRAEGVPAREIILGYVVALVAEMREYPDFRRVLETDIGLPNIDTHTIEQIEAWLYERYKKRPQ
jgi:hypothetical protein